MDSRKSLTELKKILSENRKIFSQLLGPVGVLIVLFSVFAYGPIGILYGIGSCLAASFFGLWCLYIALEHLRRDQDQ